MTLQEVFIFVLFPAIGAVLGKLFVLGLIALAQ